MSATIFTSVYAERGEIERFDGFAIVRMRACTFITTPMELARALDWARTCPSSGNPARDRSAFVERMVNVLAPAGSNLASRGDRRALTQIVRGMRACGVPTTGWNVPGDVELSVSGGTAPRSDDARRTELLPPFPATPAFPAARR